MVRFTGGMGSRKLKLTGIRGVARIKIGTAKSRGRRLSLKKNLGHSWEGKEKFRRDGPEIEQNF